MWFRLLLQQVPLRCAAPSCTDRRRKTERRRKEKRGSISMGQKRTAGSMEAHDGTVASCLQDDDSQGSKRTRYSLPGLPEEIWHHIHNLAPMRNAAKAACVSHAFQRSWRCHPNLTLTKETICSKENLRHWTGDEDDKRDRREYNNNIDKILANHICTGVKALQLDFYGPYNTKSYSRLNSWLQIAVTPGIEKLTFSLLSHKSKYDFPCSLLSDRSGSTVRHLSIDHCALRPTVDLGLRCLTELELYEVGITGDELGRLLSGSFALEKLKLTYCDDIIRLEIPCLLQRLNCLEVSECLSLQVVENKAPNISRFDYAGDEVQLSLGESLRVKELKLYSRCVVSYAIDKLPFSAPNLEILTLWSRREIVNAPMVPNKFLHLKELNISVGEWNSNQEYDFLSLVSFHDASPSLEIFVLFVSAESRYDLVVGDPSTLRQMAEHRHDRLKTVRIAGFCPQKSLVELTRHILDSATSLKFLLLDTVRVYYRCSGDISGRKCSTLNRAYINEAYKSVVAVKLYVEDKVPSTVRLDVLEPCKRCHVPCRI